MHRFYNAAKSFCARAEENPQNENWGDRWRWFILVFAMAAAACGALLLGQDCTWDVLNYHFYSGYAFLFKPLQYDLAPAQRQSFFNPMLHVISYLMLANLPSVAVAVLLAAIQGLNFYLVFRIAQILFRNWPDPFRFLLSVCSAAVGCYSSGFILGLGATFGDNLISLLILSSLLLIFRYIASEIDGTPARVSFLAIAGALLGAAFGLKLTVAIYVASIALALPAILIVLKCRFRPLLLFFAFIGIGFVATYGVWGYSLYREYQSPIYPFMNSIFRSPYFTQTDLVDSRFFPTTWQQKYFYPFFFVRRNTLASEVIFRDVRLAICYIAVVFIAAMGLFRLLKSLLRKGNGTTDHRSPALLWFLSIFFPASYILWLNQFSIYRYLIVLELLAPAFIALVLSRFIKKRIVVLMTSLFLFLIICRLMVPADFGRQKFDDDFLKVAVPAIEDMDKSVVLMSGGEATAFIIPYFPARTRFVRVYSNFHEPGQCVNLDNKIHGILAKYDARHTYVFVAEGDDRIQMRRDLRHYGVEVDDKSCRQILRRAGNIGYICSAKKKDSQPSEILNQLTSAEPKFMILPDVRLEMNPQVAHQNDRVPFRVSGSGLKAIDLLYSINGERQPPQKGFFLDEQRAAAFPISAATPKGLYHFIGIRSSTALDSDPWIEVDARLLVR
ncbi:MAG: hypothetical protein JXA73_14760 [Acidobacteria bacterium]|nr:hypothetical protein [Acidobacteriota bacterium]